MNTEPQFPQPRVGPMPYAHELLILAESYYLESGAGEIAPDIWYANGVGMLGPTDRTYVNYEDIFRINKMKNGGWKNRGCAIYRNLESAMRDAGMVQKHNMLDHCTIGNCFLRPAYKGQSLRLSQSDVTHASSFLKAWVERQNVRLLICASSFAYYSVVRYLVLPCDVVKVVHPACVWWNRGSGKYGRQKFINTLKTFAKQGGAPDAFVACATPPPSPG